MKLWAVELTGAVPPLTLTASEEQRDLWIEQGAAVVVYEFDATVVYPVVEDPTPPASE